MLCARSMLVLLLCFCNIIWDEVLWCLYHGFLFSHRISLAILDHSLFVKNIFICWQLHTCIQCPLPSSHSLQTPFPTHPLPPSWILLLGLGNILSPIRATSYNVDWSCWLDPVWLNIDAVSSWIQWPWRVTASSQSSSSYTLSSPSTMIILSFVGKEHINVHLGTSTQQSLILHTLTIMSLFIDYCPLQKLLWPMLIAALIYDINKCLEGSLITFSKTIIVSLPLGPMTSKVMNFWPCV